MNTYSTTWFETFLEAIPLAQTEREVAFLARFLPQPRYATILDLCCGDGRHARLLAERGYRVTGLDRDERVVEKARRASKDVKFIVGDMRSLKAVPGNFDATLCLWQSLGHFDDATNGDIVKQIMQKLVSHGRFILDIYHRGFFKANLGTRAMERGDRTVTERKWMQNNRLAVQLDYGKGHAIDQFEWRLYTPREDSRAGRTMRIRNAHRMHRLR